MYRMKTNHPQSDARAFRRPYPRHHLRLFRCGTDNTQCGQGHGVVVVIFQVRFEASVEDIGLKALPIQKKTLVGETGRPLLNVR